MFQLNDDLSLYVTRGDIVFFSVSAADEDGNAHEFQAGDVLRIKVFTKKDAENVVLQKDFPVMEAAETVELCLTEEDTKIGEVISKPTDYWYEIELNPYTDPQTIIGYDEDGPKVFKLFPEGKDIPEVVVEPEDVPVVDTELDMTSTRPVQNQAIARAVASIKGDIAEVIKDTAGKFSDTAKASVETNNSIAVERARIDNMVSGATADDAEILDVRVGTLGEVYTTAGNAVRGQVSRVMNRVDGIVDGIIDACGQQILDMAAAVQGVSIDINTGGEVSASAEYYAITSPMVVNEYLEHYIKYDANTRTYLYFYDQNGAYLGHVFNTQSGKLDAFPANTKFVKIVFLRNDDADIVSDRSIWLLEGSEKIASELILPEGIVTEDNCSFFVRDLLKQGEVEYNMVFNPENGVPYAAENRAVTGFIDVANLDCLTTNFTFFVAYYDDTKTFISDIADKSMHQAGTLVLPENERLKYVRILFITSDNAEISAYHISNCEDTYAEEHILRHSCLPTGATESNWYAGKKIVAYGDSITEGNKWQPYVSNKLGCTMINCGIGGTTVANNGDIRAYNGVEIESWMCGDDRINLIPEDCDMILLFGGANDWAQSAITMGSLGDGNLIDTTFKSAYSLMIKKIVNKFPKAKLVALTLINGRTNAAYANEDKQYNVRNYSLYDFSVAIKEVCMYFGVPCIDVHGESGISTFNHTTYIGDVVHPNDAGGKAIANAVINGLKRYEPIDF